MPTARHRRNEGFTLVELMVAVFIIGVLVAFAVPMYMSVTLQSTLKSCQASQRMIEGAIITYNLDGGTPYVDALVDSTNDLVDGGPSGTRQVLRYVPHCPAGTTAMFYFTVAGVVTGDQAVNATTGNSTMNHAHY